MSRATIEQFVDIKILATDFDGIWTDGKVYFSQSGTETVLCDRRDSNLLKKLWVAGVYICVISKEANLVVQARCDKMKVEGDQGVPCYQAIEQGDGKAQILKRIAKEQGVSLSQVAFMGDDVNDIAAMRTAGIAITVADGHFLNKEIADYITTKKGGDGAVREIIELILEGKGVSLEV